jgi:beta-glucosidase
MNKLLLRQTFKVFSCAILIAALLQSCKTGKDSGEPLYLDPQASVDDRVEDLLSRMTLEEKIAQINLSVGHIIVPSDARSKRDSAHIDSLRNMISSGMVGCIYNLKETYKANEVQKLAEQSRLKIPVMVSTDAIHGHGQYGGVTIFPTPIGIASTWDPEQAEKVAAITALEMRATGVHWTYSPNIDVVRDPRWGRVGESFGEDPLLVGEMGNAFVRGYEKTNADPGKIVLSCLKHFAGGGAPSNGINFAPAEITGQTLHEIYLPPFVAGVKEGSWSVMAAHNEIGGVPCHISKYLMTDMLRKTWGFKGIVIGDYTDVDRLVTLHRVAPNKKDAVRQAFDAGIDMHNHGAGFIEPMAELVREGVFSEKQIDHSVRIMLRAKFELGLFENRYIDVDAANEFNANPEHRSISLDIARKTIVLLKNEGSLLPLSTEQDNIFITGPNADNLSVYGDWVFPQPEKPITVLDGIRSLLGEGKSVDYYDCGNFRALNAERIAEAVKRAKKAKLAIVVVGGNGIRYLHDENTLGESEDRSDIDMPGMQHELVKAIHATGTPVIMVLLGGRPLAIPWEAENIPAIVQGWEPGMMGGQAVAEVLFGKVNPGGKLPITMLRSVGHIENYYNHKPSQFFLKYKLTSHENVFNFGHGLSYTTFEYKDLVFPEKVGAGESHVKISVNVANTGKVQGDEVVQVYINDMLSSLTQPVQRLVGFRRIPLEPGESQTVSFDIPLDNLKIVDINMKWVLEPGQFRLMVGSASDDIRHEGIFEVVGE